MEKLKIEHDISLLYIPASSFPQGVLEAHQKLHALVVFDSKRRFFGLSRPEDAGGIEYKAAAEIMIAGEEKNLGLNQITLPRGTYLSLRINDFRKDIPAIGKTFSILTSQPGIDPQGYCVESYPNLSDVICMVRLAD